MPSKSDFKTEIENLIMEALESGEDFIDITSKCVHEKVGGYPSRIHNMPGCCDAMYELKKEKDEILHAPNKGKGATLKIRYYL
ncbi:hypothetical protein QA612_20210 [Evansella sp. AB-P1]|uniref:hypothetical protein n=1 Tax=Evansella sp. AB-P1 TaxID=3037653 RepID=UPI00241EDA75|nr:hypothetical protein [Evansella sp. AB-P1]MDG5789786.1 hypothetical protein [Evansella sp. AB-P1]